MKRSALAAFASLPATTGLAAPATPPPNYQVTLDEREPTRIEITMRSAPGAPELLTTPPTAAQSIVDQPSCGDRPLTQIAAGRWLRRSDCALVRWSARLAKADIVGIDAADPKSGWSGRNRVWIVTGALPWLRKQNQRSAEVSIVARLGRQVSTRKTTLPPAGGVPMVVIVGQPVQTYRADGFSMLVFGDAPADADRLQRAVAATWARWRRDLVPLSLDAPHQLKVGWVKPRPGTERGLFASTGSDAILMQYVPDPLAANAADRLKAMLFVTGAHEGFHALAAVRGAPAWANESLASYFAYLAAKQTLSPAALAIPGKLVDMTSNHGLLSVEQRIEKGDQSDYGSFYGKGARFWAAVENVLTIPPNRSGRLATLIQRTNGMEGMDWRNADSIAAYLDHYSDGRAGPIVRCFLVEDRCPEANKPIS